jgi:hypothetical protein
LASQEGRKEAVKLLLNYKIKFKYNKEHATFIDLAIRYKREEVLLTIISNDRWEEAFSLSSHEYQTPLIGIIKISSEITMAVMERCVTRTFVDNIDRSKYIVNYKVIL